MKQISRFLTRPPVHACARLHPSGVLSIVVAIMLAACTGSVTGSVTSDEADSATPGAAMMDPNTTAILAGGCFWCVEADFEKLEGVSAVESGYAGGRIENPTYEQVSRGQTEHVESVRIHFDPAVVSYEQLLQHFWKNVDPTVADRQFCDQGRHYRTVIYPLSEEQTRIAEASRQAIIDGGKIPRVLTTIEPTQVFWLAEDYHQDYYKVNPLRYNYYRLACGRDKRLEELWG